MTTQKQKKKKENQKQSKTMKIINFFDICKIIYYGNK